MDSPMAKKIPATGGCLMSTVLKTKRSLAVQVLLDNMGLKKEQSIVSL